MKKLIPLLLLLSLNTAGFAQKNDRTFGQTTPAADRKNVLENLLRTRDTLISETQGLSKAQWNFRETPERWSIAEIVEHLGNWELLWGRELQMMSQNKPQPELRKTCQPDSYYHDFIMEEKPHISPDLSRPTGLIEGSNTIMWFTKLRDINIKFAENLKIDMRDYFENTNMQYPRNMYNVYIYVWGHVDRHIRQIKKVKAHPNYPK